MVVTGSSIGSLYAHKQQYKFLLHEAICCYKNYNTYKFCCLRLLLSTKL